MQADEANPFNGIFISYYSAPSFVDLDGDGDMDAFIGFDDGTISYYKNTGTTAVPAFALQAGTANPFQEVDAGFFSAPAFVDIDGDGDMDAFIGSVISITSSTISYYKNTSVVLPLHLLSFGGSRTAGYNQLHWQTAAEENTRRFELEVSSDGRNYIKIAAIDAVGNSNNNYSIKDNSVYNGKVFYRLKMVDADGRFTYSPVIWINSGQVASVTIYPNPATDMLHIDIGNAGILKTKAGIYDANGRLMHSILINSIQPQINVQQFAKGVYIIKFADGTAQSFMKE